MTMRVDPPSLRTFSTELRTGAGHADRIHGYLTKYSSLTLEQQGFMGKVSGAHDKFAHAAAQALTHLTDLLNGSADELSAVATNYAMSDQASRDQLDATVDPNG